MKKRNPYLGKWRITQMEMWDQAFIDMETEGHFNFEEDELGSFQFGLVKDKLIIELKILVKLKDLSFHGKVKMKMM